MTLAINENPEQGVFAGVVDALDKKKIVNISANCRGPRMGYSGDRGKLTHEKNLKSKRLVSDFLYVVPVYVDVLIPIGYHTRTCAVTF
jgi:hypothetical protein